jgi:hypothetical protein
LADRKIHWEETSKIKWLLTKITEAEKNVAEKLELIESAYATIMEDEIDAEWNETRTSRLSEINRLAENISEQKDSIQSFIDEIYWHTNEEWEEFQWVKKDVIGFYKAQIKKFENLFKRIEKELNAGTTSLKLAKTFSDEVTKYNSQANIRAWVFLLVLWLIVYLWYTSIWLKETPWLDEILLYWAFRLPLVSGIVRLAIFASNRRAEAKKLEESYKHKEVMARSFMGYKESIEQLQKESWESDYQLLEKHMDNLLDTIADDSSKFMIDRWESHPFVEMVEKVISKWKVPKSFDDIAGKYSFNLDVKKE